MKTMIVPPYLATRATCLAAFSFVTRFLHMEWAAIVSALCLMLSAGGLIAAPLGTAFTYQGQFTDAGEPVNGTYDLRFTLYDAMTGGVAWDPMVTNAAVVVSDGVFTTQVDFGIDPFDGTARWLEIAVAPSSSSLFAPLEPRQPLTPAPYVLHARSADGVVTGAIDATMLSDDAVTASKIASNAVESANIADGTIRDVDVDEGSFDTTFWKTAGNAGTMTDTHFLGTTDEQPLEFRVNNLRVLRLEGNGNRAPNLIGGSPDNRVDEGIRGVAIAGGAAHRVWSDFGVVGGGMGNFIGFDSLCGTVSGGRDNAIRGEFYSTVGGGFANTNASGGATIGGGRENLISSESHEGFIGGGRGNVIQHSARFATIAGGCSNRVYASSPYSVIAGGYGNYIDINSTNSLVAGGRNNGIGNHAVFSAILGGNDNTIGTRAPFSAIGGGEDNQIGGDAGYSTISGGNENAIGSLAAYSTIAGGTDHAIGDNSSCSTVGGGVGNRIANNASYATIPGGRRNSATNYALAAGHRAKANHTGAFVWADSSDADYASSGNDQFCVRATGGLQLSTNTSLYCGSQLRQMLNLWSTTYGLGVQHNTFYSRSGDRFCWFRNGSHSDSAVNPGPGGTWLMTLDGGGSLFTAGGMYPSSDRNAKENFSEVDPQEMLQKVAALPISRWNFKQQQGVEHVGPMAQDFRAAFGLGKDDKHIATVDADGVALAAIQGLNAKVEVRSQKADGKVRRLEDQLEEKNREISELRSRLERLEQIVNSLAHSTASGAL